ncbi:alpha-ketoglutarate-dependent dioxygenase AlkB [Allobranchiibius sp. GilTou73]|uniref:alpha-ketoglutarate-dependent dioxygenase AlkB n=1 Tax=unclassified Allobranchiibius TaxID=2649857 RepID=UPI001AA16B5A|nr:alpha-ketoglutarate-dependent dioxygenase AlkB [Allobranchiibius sp. GilTou73]MBO1766344.1 alpha-ketoglutarate-dependent dioxygenase AlkB [Allobranchiibius sp. GilTou38]UIJ34057.1 alpha-ketoglutarate-dependent dioxygenase AlkB [Allobranchiibius sp. GilTou73]
MADDALFDLPTPPGADVDVTTDLQLTGGLRVAVDHTFATVERIQLDDTSWVDHVHGWLVGDQALMDMLMAEADWEQRSRWMYTREVTEPRLTAEYPVIAQAPHPVLHYLAAALTVHYGRSFTRLWMNWYRDHNDGTGWHADRPADQQAEAVIPVLSLGASRRFLIRPEDGGKSRTILTHGGDLVVMGGRTQRDYRHSVPRQKPAAGPRLSLNFSIDPPRHSPRDMT